MTDQSVIAPAADATSTPTRLMLIGGEWVEAADGDVPVFWACGVTPQAALMASRPPFAITHAPGHMFVTDVPDAVYRQS